MTPISTCTQYNVGVEDVIFADWADDVWAIVGFHRHLESVFSAPPTAATGIHRVYPQAVIATTEGIYLKFCVTDSFLQQDALISYSGEPYGVAGRIRYNGPVKRPLPAGRRIHIENDWAIQADDLGL